jgi:trehalose 6-phosphate phosphatase
MHRFSSTPPNPWAFFFDFDGTLVEISDSPDLVHIPTGLGNHLAHLSKRAQHALAIVTGRRIADIDRMLAPHHLDVAGVHGAEIRIGSKVAVKAFTPSRAFTEILAELYRRFGEKGLLIEDKGMAVAVHWRLHPDYEPDIRRFMEDAASLLGKDYRLQYSKAVAEIVPATSTKEKAIEQFLGSPCYRARLPIFFGDDLTDESGFDLANRKGGISVRIGAGPTTARYRLANSETLRLRLMAWAKGAPIDLAKDLSP